MAMPRGMGPPTGEFPMAKRPCFDWPRPPPLCLVGGGPSPRPVPMTAGPSPANFAAGMPGMMPPPRLGPPPLIPNMRPGLEAPTMGLMPRPAQMDPRGPPMMPIPRSPSWVPPPPTGILAPLLAPRFGNPPWVPRAVANGTGSLEVPVAVIEQPLPAKAAPAMQKNAAAQGASFIASPAFEVVPATPYQPAVATTTPVVPYQPAVATTTPVVPYTARAPMVETTTNPIAVIEQAASVRMSVPPSFGGPTQYASPPLGTATVVIEQAAALPAPAPPIEYVSPTPALCYAGTGPAAVILEQTPPIQLEQVKTAAVPSGFYQNVPYQPAAAAAAPVTAFTATLPIVEVTSSVPYQPAAAVGTAPAVSYTPLASVIDCEPVVGTTYSAGALPTLPIGSNDFPSAALPTLPIGNEAYVIPATEFSGVSPLGNQATLPPTIFG